jgi:hypothetical protein
VTYRISNGSRANGARSFTAIGAVGGYSTFTLSTIDAASGGAEMAGREMRESRKLFSAKLNEAHSIIARLSK